MTSKSKHYLWGTLGAAFLFFGFFAAGYGPNFYQGEQSRMKFHVNLDDYFPYHVSYGRDFKQHGFVFWDRHVIAGGPYLSLMAQPLHPLTFLAQIMPPFFAHWATLFIFLLISYCGYFKLLRERFGLNVIAGASVALVYAGLFMQWPESQPHKVAPFAALPWIVLWFERYQSERARNNKNLLWCILGIAACMYSINATFLPIVLLAHGVYILTLSRARPILSDVGAFFCVYAFGFVLYLPVALTLLQDVKLSMRTEYLDSGVYAYGVKYFFRFLFYSVGAADPALAALYFAWLFLPGEIPLWRRLGNPLLFLIPPFLAGDMGLNNWLGPRIPAVAAMAFERSFYAFYFFVPLALVLFLKEKQIKVKPLFVLCVGALALWLGWLYWKGAFIAAAFSKINCWQDSPACWAPKLVLLHLCGLGASLLATALPAFKSYAWRTSWLPLFLAATLAVHLRHNLSQGVSFADNFSIHSANLRELVQISDSNVFRVMISDAAGYYGHLITPQYHGLFNAGGRTNNASKRFRDFFSQIYYGSPTLYRRFYGQGIQNFSLDFSSDKKWLSLLGTKYWISPLATGNRDSPQVVRMERILGVDEAGITIFRNDEALPKALMIGQFEIFKTKQAMFDAIRSYRGSLRAKTFLLEEDVQNHNLPPSRPLPGGAVEVLRYEPDLITLRASCPQPGILILTDAWHPDWEAAINGEPAAIFPIMAFYRGIVVPAGENQSVEFKFNPKRTFLGFKIVVAGFLLLAIWFFAPRRGPVEMDSP